MPCCLVLHCREWRAQLQVALDAQCVGMLRLETGALKATYTNTLKSAQATIAMLMVVAGRRAAQAAVDKLQAITRCVRHAGQLPPQTQSLLQSPRPSKATCMYMCACRHKFERLPSREGVS